MITADKFNNYHFRRAFMASFGQNRIVSDPQNDFPSAPSSAQFRTTHWSVVLEAREAESPHAIHALEALCRTYWYPLYAYVRRRGHASHAAQDLTQEFFARLVERNILTAVRQERGKFRWFLLSALQRFLANEWNRGHAAKRGGRQIIVSLDEKVAEGRYRFEAVDHATPETLFDQSWAMTLLEQAQDRRSGPLAD